MALVDGWAELTEYFEKSKLSRSIPTVEPKSKRALRISTYHRAVGQERIVAAGGCRYHVYADFARYYGSIYTHAIAWALHGQDKARSDEKTVALLGNKLDQLVRATQDRQSIGIPVGPDTSFALAEIIGTAIDVKLQADVRRVQGIRFVDDFHLYFRTRGECERAIARLHGISRGFELDINDGKTLIEELPDIVEPSWKSTLRNFPFDASQNSNTAIVSYFNIAFEFFKERPFDGILKYAVRRVEKVRVKDFPLYLSLLCRCAIAEPSSLPAVISALEPVPFQVRLCSATLSSTLEEICRYHAPLHHGYEVAWALWAAVRFKLRLSKASVAEIGDMTDDAVALVALHGIEMKLLSLDSDLWQTWLTTEQLNGEHWLAAYEIVNKGWLEPPNGLDPIDSHQFFRTLRTKQVSFYERTPSATEHVDEDEDG
jgi:hypothetical protein